jgi:hypothetical protein
LPARAGGGDGRHPPGLPPVGDQAHLGGRLTARRLLLAADEMVGDGDERVSGTSADVR